jgi:hypothetical protein
MIGTVIFIALAVVALIAALGMLLSDNAIYSALFLIVNFATIAVLYLLLNAPFLAMVQVTVYAGAIMVLFLFVIMLLGARQRPGDRQPAGVGPGRRGVWQPGAGGRGAVQRVPVPVRTHLGVAFGRHDRRGGADAR